MVDKIFLLYIPTIPHQSIYSRNMSVCSIVLKNILVTAIFISVKEQKYSVLNKYRLNKYIPACVENTFLHKIYNIFTKYTILQIQ